MKHKPYTLDDAGALGILSYAQTRRLRAAAWRDLRRRSPARARKAWRHAKKRV